LPCANADGKENNNPFCQQANTRHIVSASPLLKTLHNKGREHHSAIKTKGFFNKYCGFFLQFLSNGEGYYYFTTLNGNYATDVLTFFGK
jgi:hypothetical protein